MKDHTSVVVASVPLCDINPQHGLAYADAKLSIGPWANVCRACFTRYGCTLGLGRGQRLVARTAPEGVPA